jgi:trehalose 6-phosphate phosphatase
VPERLDPPEETPPRSRRAGGGSLRRAPPPLATDCALFLDIDGTLLDLAATPDRVRVDADVAALLPALAARLGGAFALITGRAIADADRLFRGIALPIAGQHGCERRAADGTLHFHAPAPAGLEQLRAEIGRLAGLHEGLLLEDKGSTLALHYRRAPKLAGHLHRAVRAHLATAIAAGASLRLQTGKGIVEIKPDGRDKGTAIAEYMAEPPFAGRVPVFVGDDRTDEYGFEAVARMGGWGVKVGRERTVAPYRLPNVAMVRRWLVALLSAAGNDMERMDDA